MMKEGTLQAEAAPRGWLRKWLPGRGLSGGRSLPVEPGATGAATQVQMNLHTLCWIGLCCIMAYAGAVQSNGAAYLMAFLTGALGLISYIHARANLRGLEVRVGAVPVFQAGMGEVLSVELRAVSGHTPYGIEVVMVGTSKPAFVEQIPSGQTVRLQLRLPKAGQPLRLLLRSAYPLGLLRAQRLVNVELTRHAIPPAAGNLPLPKATSAMAGADNRSTAWSTPSREGDDFAGVREWQPGDSPKHIDWRAVARGRPLMVKTWARGSSSALHLDWEAVPLPEVERAGQMVRWIQECEQQGLTYSLKVPGQEVPAGQGAAHARRCLAALAEVHARGGMNAVETVKRQRVPPSHERRAGVPRGPLALLSGVLFLMVLPLQGIVAVPVIIFLFLCLSYRSLISQPVKQRWLPLTLTAVGIAGVVLTQGDLLNMEAGMALLIALAGGKMLESRSPHDFQVIAMIGWFFCLCGLLADQSIAQALLMFAGYVLIAGCMVRFRRGVSGVKVPVWLTGRLLLQALPLMLLLFVMFPRLSLDSLGRIGSRRTAITGVPSSLDPGSVLALAKNTDKAFRVEFPQGTIPPNDQRYWRCVVLWECQGLSWNRGLGTSFAPRMNNGDEGGIFQTITLEPHGQMWLPALDYPVRGMDGRSSLALSTERVLSSHNTVQKMRRFDVLSRPQLEWEPMKDWQRSAALQLPGYLSPTLRELAQEWRNSSRSDLEVVEAGLMYLRRQGFKYTLEPGSYLGPGALEEFFLRRRVGFCEHFSAAFATMMRAAGVGSRVIMGYQGGEMSSTGTHLIVRQSDAHSWTEVWIEGRGWVRVDPTAALAPDRVNLGLQSFMMGQGGEAAEDRDTWWWRTRDQAEMMWEQVNDQWYNWVVSYDEDLQAGWLSRLGLGEKTPLYLFLGSLGIVLLFFVLLSLWLRRGARDGDPWRVAWARLCLRLEGMGLPARRESEGPLAYARRVSADHPGVTDLAQQYAVGRYGASETSVRSFEKAVKALH